MTETVSNSAKQDLLTAGNISDGQLETMMSRMMSREIDRGELFFQCRRNESWSLEQGIVKSAGFSVSRGIGARAISGEKSGFAYADDIKLDVLEQTSSAARSIARVGSSQRTNIPVKQQFPEFYQGTDPIVSVSKEEKVKLLSRIDKFARSLDPRVKEVSVSINANHESTYIYSSDGTDQGDVRPLVRFGVSVVVEQNGRRENGNAGGGGRHDLSWLYENESAENFAREAVR